MSACINVSLACGMSRLMSSAALCVEVLGWFSFMGGVRWAGAFAWPAGKAAAAVSHVDDRFAGLLLLLTVPLSSSSFLLP